ncbi:MAG: Formate dehydrogenase related protein [Hydrogenibacillus schlegelii]|uniref:Formate dehydrogenase related protein n=1 Tax=Hydrogenibacillus schlegelii TaxID=1484 RepID=A0A2T5G6H4_HYDSH|nr:formate dehydrogenase subunit alpha [Hydrogenibacillus schlegelii]PTQ51796.1 MAG: Formate dehydrogenase related protein [Hydrogenibacillus schlegelii]
MLEQRERTWTITVNGVQKSVDPARLPKPARRTYDGRAAWTPTVLEWLLSESIVIPHVCYHESLGPIQTCDTCIVQVDGELVRACSTPLRDGQVIETMAPRAEAARREAMDRILVNHELYCTVCDNNNGNCDVHNTVRAMNIDHQSKPFTPKPYAVDDSHPFYRYDPNQCILCGRCVEACQNLQVNETLSIDWSLDRPRVVWDGGVPIDESSCVSCGHCVTVCPCNALMEKSMLGRAGTMTSLKPEVLRPMIEVTKAVEPGYRQILLLSEIESKIRERQIKKTKTVCTYCGVGCSFEIWTKGREILKVEPKPEAPANGISTCVKGKFGWDYVNSPDRLTRPLIRKNNRFVEATWDEALDLIAERFSDIRARYGPDALAFIASSKCTNEEAYLMQKLARAVIGTNNVDNCSRYCQSPATEGLFRTVGYGGDSGSISDIAQADLVIIIGSNTAESHPVLATRVKRAQKLHGQKLIVADLRKHEMAERADLFLRPEPGTDHVWLSAVTKYIIDRGWADRAFIEARVEGFDEYVRSLEPFTLAYAEKVTGIPQADLIRVAESIHAARSTCILWAMGVTQQCGGSDTSTAISNLLLVTGNYGRPGTGAYPLRGHNNVQGTSDFGAMPMYFPGYEKVTDDEVRQRYEAAWGVKLPAHPGLDNHQMVDAIHAGKLKAMYIIGEDMSLVDANANYVQAAFEKLEFMVVQDLFFSKTAQFADVVLPASPSLEKEGTFTNTERRIQRLYRALEPLGESKPDWEIIMAIANRLGAEWTYRHPSEIMAEAASLAPLFAGVTYERLEGFRSLQWPVAPDGTDSPRLYEKEFPFPGGKARLVPVAWIPPEPAEPVYDLHVNNGRLLEHFHEGNMTYRSSGLAHKVPEAFLEVSPELAKERGIETGALVRLISPYGSVKVRVLVTDRVRGRELYLPMNDAGEAAINYLTSSKTDRVTNTPAYKDVKVRMEVIEPRGKSPLPKHNHRFGRRTPQSSVQVEKKWARSDYVFPGKER